MTAVSAANAAAARAAAELIKSQKLAEQLRAELQITKDSLAAAALQIKADATAGMRYPSLVTCYRLGDLFRAAQYIAYYCTLHLPIANAAADLAAAAAAAAAKRATTNPARSLQSIKLSTLPPHGAADICGKPGVSGTVYRIMYQGITCAFKKFHPQMFETVRREIQSLQVKIIYFSI